MKFVTLFPEMKNVHLIKSCGMVPYILFKYYDYDSKIVGYKNDDNYDYINNEVKGLKIEFLKKRFHNSTLDSCLYILKNNKNIDVLHLYHMTPRSFWCALIYKLLNRDGLVYLKTDNSNINVFDKNWFKKKMKIKAINVFDIISSESYDACQHFNKNFPVHFEYIQNGFYDNEDKKVIEKKENIILTVARIGDVEKANDVMLNGFAEAAKFLLDWKLRLVGNVNEKFKEFIAEYFTKYPELKDRVEFVGAIQDRKILNMEYQKAKVFTLTSISEGFPTVFLEAIKSGCYIVTSDIGVANEITQLGAMGTIFHIGNIGEYAKALVEICSDHNRLKELAPKIQAYAYSKYYWPTTCGKLNDLILKAKHAGKKKVRNAINF